MTSRLAALAAACTVVALTGCLDFEHTHTITAPTTTESGSDGLAALAGTWVSATVVPSASNCTNFHWSVTEQTSTSAKGAFSATCTGSLQVQGTAQGTLSGSTVVWTANATGTAPNLPSCAITLTGTAEISATSVRVPYSGNTCLGSVSGVETLQRH